MLTSCADYFETNDFMVQRPGNAEQYDYLNDYKPLKEYLNRSAHPNFKVSAALDASDFNNKQQLYALALTNFDEIVAGNAFKMASCVDDKGNMDFGTVESFVNNAEEAGLSVYGHTLFWHAQQPNKYLYNLIKDKPMPTPDGPTEIQEEEVTSVSYTDGAFPFYPMGCEPPVIDGAIHFVPTGDWSQFFISNAITLEPGDYALVLNIKSSEEGTIKLTLQNGWGADAQQLTSDVKLTTDWSEVTVKFNELVGGNYDPILKPETFGGTIDLKGFRVIRYKEVAVAPDTHLERKQVANVTYTDGPFPFYPMGSEPPVIDGAIHFVPTGEWSQFFISTAIALEPGNYEVDLNIKSSEEGTIKLTMQNGWGGDAQQITQDVKLSTDWSVVTVKFNDLVGGNYDPILKPETFGGTLDVKSLSIYKMVEVTGPIAKEVHKYTYTDGPFPFYPMGCEPPIIDGAIHFVPTGEWSQFFIGNAVALEPGDYAAILHIKSSQAGTIKLTAQNGWGGDAQQLTGDVKVSENWDDVTVKFNELVGGNYDFILKPETFGGTIDLQSATIVKYEQPASGGGTVDVEKTKTEKKRTIVVESDDMVEYAWDTQFWIMTDGFSSGSSYEFSAEVRADKSSSASTQIHNGPGEYVHYEAVGNVSFTPDWEVYSSKGTLNADGKSIAFNLNETAEGTKYYFRNMSFKVNGVELLKNGNLEGANNNDYYTKEKRGETVLSPILDQITYTKLVPSNTIPLTKEEKTELLYAYMQNWIGGMFNATGGKVKAWDLINEPMDGNGGLQKREDDEDTSAFFWQEHLGDVEYGVLAERAAREAWAQIEGTNPADLKLFINDYNLEWQTAKLDGLISWIQQVEAAGAKIDGIGTQMHITLWKNANDYEKQKKGITDMLTKMVQTGKLVRISELDMGIADKQWGTGKKTSEITFEEEQLMAEFYKWIVEEYFRVVPENQQYGICQWCITDAPASSGWRGGEPVGLWTVDYLRKPAYAGWAEGLQK